MRNSLKLLLVAIVFTACAQGAVKSETPTPATPQGLFGRWQQENTTTVIDGTGGSLQNEFYFKFLPPRAEPASA